MDHENSPGAITLAVPTVQWPNFNPAVNVSLSDEDINRILEPSSNPTTTFLDLGLMDEFVSGPVPDGPLVKDGEKVKVEESDTDTVTDSDIESDSYSDTEYESSEYDSEEDKTVQKMDELCEGTKSLKMDK